jgi:hypothetical protein
MKNVRVLPTDKTSNGYILGKCIKELSDVKIGQFTKTYHLMFSEEYFQPHNIYITSDETIKEGDWVIDDEQDVFQVLEINHTQGILRSDGFTYVINICKKIILTTDQDLIKDGVEPIPDDFLEWFVKNPSCESVEVEKWTDYKLKNNEEVIFFNYKIKYTISKEKPKNK